MTREPTDSEILWYVPWECYECGGQKYAEEQAREEIARDALTTADPSGSAPDSASSQSPA